MAKCHAADCDNDLPTEPPSPRERKWCSGRCRKTQYASSCVDCGAPTSGSEGRKATPLCLTCANVRSGDRAKIWTPDAVILAIQEWAAAYGEPPASKDWNPWHARQILGDEERAARFESACGQWPSFQTTLREFGGSWNAAIRAAGFETRPVGGGGGNLARRRDRRAAA